MDDSYDLFGGVLPHQRHSTTSRSAARSMRQRIGPLHAKILAYLQGRTDGACDERMGRDLGIVMNTLRPRRRELQLMGRIVDSGRTELTESGRSAVIWVLNRGEDNGVNRNSNP